MDGEMQIHTKRERGRERQEGFAVAVVRGESRLA